MRRQALTGRFPKTPTHSSASCAVASCVSTPTTPSGERGSLRPRGARTRRDLRRLGRRLLPGKFLAALPALEAGDRAAPFYPLPDVALLTLSDPRAGHPCVRFDKAELVSGSQPDILHVSAYTQGEHAPGTSVPTSATSPTWDS